MGTFRRSSVIFPTVDTDHREIVWYKPVRNGTGHLQKNSTKSTSQDIQVNKEEKQLSTQWKSDNICIPQHWLSIISYKLHFCKSTARLLLNRYGGQEKGNKDVDPSNSAIIKNEYMVFRDPIR